jgi:RND family efflux transporter MFP subunit
MKSYLYLFSRIREVHSYAALSAKFQRWILLASFSVLGLLGCQKHEDPDPRLEAPFVPLATALVSESVSRSFTGVVMARVQSNLGFRVPGKVIERLVDTGASVREGQPLMRLDRTDFLHEIANREGAVTSAKAHAIQTAADVARYRNLLAKGVVSQQEYDHAKADDDSAQSLLAAAEAQAQEAIDNDQYTELRADADGVVMETLAKPGQVVVAGQTVVKLARSGPREASVNLPETLRPVIGSRAQAVLYGGNSQVFVAHLRQLSDQADPLTRTFEARYVMEGKGAEAALGATVTLTIDGIQSECCVSVPLGAIDDEGKGLGVWIFDSNRSQVSFRPVQVRQFGNETAEITDGLHVGEQVVAMGGHYLHDGERVRSTEIKAAMQ